MGQFDSKLKLSAAEIAILSMLLGTSPRRDDSVVRDLDDFAKMAAALSFATAAHGSTDQRRKYTDRPYVEHAMAVVDIIASVPHDVELMMAGVLHDVVEDTKITVEMIDAFFGPRVAKLVDEVTDRTTPEHGNRKTRREMERKRLANVSPEAKTIKLADMIDNTRDIGAHDPGFAKVYMPEKRAILPSLIGGDKRLYVHALGQVNAYFRANPGL